MAVVESADKADAFKEEANKFFKDGDYDKAIEKYTEALAVKESAVYFSNRSLAYLRTECFGYALEDASKAIALDNSYIKGYYRRAMVYMALEKFKEALQDLETVRLSIVCDTLYFELHIPFPFSHMPLDFIPVFEVLINICA
ncbi:unnamed protein product [Dicrocoelium dendriticum]|nr:unnamed protein product [Dicrocoelium dendriticum]